MATPRIPHDMIHPEDVDVKFDLDALWEDVCRELTNPKFRSRTHGNRKTYDSGCDGPICKKSSRDYSRRRYNAEGQFRWAVIDPIIIYFEELAKMRIIEAEAEIISKLIG